MAGLVLGMSGNVIAQDINVGTVEMQEVLMGHPAIQEAQQELQQEQMTMMEEMEDLDEEEQQARQQEMQQELEMLQQELMQSAIEEVEADIEEAAETLGYDVVLNPEAIVTGEEELETDNITEEVMDELDIEADMGDMMP